MPVDRNSEDPNADEPEHDAEHAPEQPLAAGGFDRTRLLSRFTIPKRRLTKVQVTALVLFSLLTLGPVVALVMIFRNDTDPQPVLVSEQATPDSPPPVGGVHMMLTVVSVNAVTGEMGVRAQFTPDIGLTTTGGALKSDLAILTDDVRGNHVKTLPAGQPTGPAEVVTGLKDGSISRYPFDRYTGQVWFVLSQQESSGRRKEIPVTVTVQSGVSDLGVSAAVVPASDPALGRLVTFNVRRNAPTLLFSVGMMALWWALAVSAVLLVWSVAIWRATVPAWAYGYMVGVLFALTPLRSALPGSPPLGVLVDYVSFYWAILIVGVGLLMLLAYFIRDLREQSRHGIRT